MIQPKLHEIRLHVRLQRFLDSILQRSLARLGLSAYRHPPNLEALRSTLSCAPSRKSSAGALKEHLPTNVVGSGLEDTPATKLPSTSPLDASIDCSKACSCDGFMPTAAHAAYGIMV